MHDDLESERQRLARRLEQDLIPSLNLILSQVHVYQHGFQDNAAVYNAMTLLQTLVTHSITKARDLQENLNPTILEKLGLPAALETLIARYRHGAGLTVDFDLQWLDQRFDPHIEQSLFHTAHTLLDAAAEHHIAHIAISLHHEENLLTLAVEDETLTPSSEHVERIRRWIEQTGGRLTIATKPGISRRVTCQYLVLATNPLTDRELEILHLVVEGLPNKAIGQQLGISTRTVSFHLSNIYSHLNITNRTEAAVMAVARGWVDQPD